MGRGRGGVEEELNHTTAGSLVLYKSFNTLWTRSLLIKQHPLSNQQQTKDDRTSSSAVYSLDVAKVAAMWMHEAYDSHVITNDVSILKLDAPLQFNEYVQPLPLAESGRNFFYILLRMHLNIFFLNMSFFAYHELFL
jgi:hypothetical protein